MFIFNKDGLIEVTITVVVVSSLFFGVWLGYFLAKPKPTEQDENNVTKNEEVVLSERTLFP